MLGDISGVKDEDYNKLVDAAIRIRPRVFIDSDQEKLLRGGSHGYRYKDIEKYLLKNLSGMQFSDMMHIIRELIKRGNICVLGELDSRLKDVTYINIAKPIMASYPKTRKCLDHRRYKPRSQRKDRFRK